MSNFVGTTAIAGIGATEFSKDSGRSELQLACEAVLAAIDDAGLEPSEVDGMVTFTAETNPEIEIARLTGIGDLKFFSRIHHGGGAACGTIQQAAMAVAEGVADVVVVLPGLQRALRPPLRHRRPGPAAVGQRRGAHFSWYAPFGLLTPAQWVAMFGTPLHARVRRHQRGLRPGVGGRPQARRHQPEGVVLRAADHARGPPEQPVDRRAAAPARLLPGERRRPGAGRHLARAGPGPAATRRRSSSAPPRARATTSR